MYTWIKQDNDWTLTTEKPAIGQWNTSNDTGSVVWNLGSSTYTRAFHRDDALYGILSQCMFEEVIASMDASREEVERSFTYEDALGLALDNDF